MKRRIVFVVALGLVLTACSPDESAESDTTVTTDPPTPTVTVEPLPPLALTSPAFDEGQSIPATYTCDGPDFNPQLDIVGLPDNTVTLTIIVDDPDAPVGVWDHWVEYDIDAMRGDFSVPEAAEDLGTQGLNSWNLPGYGGPCPPEGQEHRYFFTVYALDDHLDLPAEIDSAGVRKAMDGKIIAEIVLLGRYAR